MMLKSFMFYIIIILFNADIFATGFEIKFKSDPVGKKMMQTTLLAGKKWDLATISGNRFLHFMTKIIQETTDNPEKIMSREKLVLLVSKCTLECDQNRKQVEHLTYAKNKLGTCDAYNVSSAVNKVKQVIADDFKFFAESCNSIKKNGGLLCDREIEGIQDAAVIDILNSGNYSCDPTL